MININNMVALGGNVKLEVNPDDLKMFAESIVERTIMSHERIAQQYPTETEETFIGTKEVMAMLGKYIPNNQMTKILWHNKAICLNRYLATKCKNGCNKFIIFAFSKQSHLIGWICTVTMTHRHYATEYNHRLYTSANEQTIMSKILTRICAFTIIITILSSLNGCSGSSEQSKQMDQAENLMESRPDSALAILNNIQSNDLRGKKQRARYALLKSMALDKNYIDTTTFDVLQPAIDYYLEKGSPDEKLKTYYYQGRIFQNQEDRDNALNSFIKGIDVSRGSVDSLYVARTLVAQAAQYSEFYDFDSYTNCHLRAAKIYKHLSHKWNEFDCLLNALNGSIALDNKTKGDSILTLCVEFKDLDSIQNLSLNEYKLSHAVKFGNIQDIENLIKNQEDNTYLDTNGLLNLALAYNKVGKYVKAVHLLDSINNRHKYDTLKYLAVSVPVLENMGDYKKALSVYKTFSHRMDSINTFRFDQKSKSIEEKHQIELKAEQDARKKTKIIWSCITGIIFLVLIVVILFLLFRSNKTQKDLAIEKAKNTELKNKQLKSDKDKAIREAKIKVLENESLRAERDKKALEAENLTYRVEILENESASLKELMDSQEELPYVVQEAIRVRIEMLNALMAGYITNNDQYEKPYESWIKELTDNTEEFMNSNRLAFKVSHPRFIQYFEDHDLTISEINYVCLYAIGLRGKEVGSYMKKRSHVNISSGIRKKLGIDKHETNIGIYVRKLLKEL